jgi:hypothetical protein
MPGIILGSVPRPFAAGSPIAVTSAPATAATRATTRSAAAAARTITTTTARTSAAAAATGGWGPCPAGLDMECVALELLAVHLGNRCLALFFRGHFHEPKTSRFAGSAVSNDFNRGDVSVRRERLTHLVFSRVGGEVPYINVH